ncbi:MAG: hypothetical protein L6R37_005204 [Teloschistes peruensis]|nr:MAG: hypothetical protein L6R37_005204 [Teloschistes peruensis]
MPSSSNPLPSKDSLPSASEVTTEVVETTKSSLTSGLRSFAAGGVGGICAVVVGHPFDLVKVRLQTAEKGVYTVAVSFWGFDVGKSLVRTFSSPQNTTTTTTSARDTPFTIAQISLAGFFSAIPMTLITAPFERVKVLLQIQGQKQLAPGEKPRYAGGVDVVRQLYKEGGIRSVFRGSAMTLARDGPGSAAYFATYEYIKRSLTPKDEHGNLSGELSLTAVMTAGGAAGVAMWIPVFPIDTIKSRLQSAEGRPTIGGTVRGLWKAGGMRAFFPGIGPAMARAVPANAATFLGVELAHKAMDRVF